MQRTHRFQTFCLCLEYTFMLIRLDCIRQEAAKCVVALYGLRAQIYDQIGILACPTESSDVAEAGNKIDQL